MTVMEDSINKAEELFDTYPVLIYPCKIYDHGKANYTAGHGHVT